MGVTVGPGVAEVAEVPKMDASEGGVAAARGLGAAVPGKRVPETPRALQRDCASSAAFSRVSVLALSDGSSSTVGAFCHVAARRLSPTGRGLLFGRFGRFPSLSPSCRHRCVLSARVATDSKHRQTRLVNAVAHIPQSVDDGRHHIPAIA